MTGSRPPERWGWWGAGARGGELAGASAEAAKQFPNRISSGCGAPGRGRAFPGCLRRESPGPQQAARRNAARPIAWQGVGGGQARALRS
ncbi:unnamed protein product [Rangifer tarandus platyrhynchus]|uniref:Uncharacterized protein n=1 Tax=Rangifer tarandus platyrhynchus TaxID=3082113 RepID=A0AC59Z083_RANTA